MPHVWTDHDRLRRPDRRGTDGVGIFMGRGVKQSSDHGDTSCPILSYHLSKV
jgi:hypothetical protein